MKRIHFNIEQHTISYYINWLGIESVLLNGHTISKKLSLGKRHHTFSLTVDGISQTFRIESKQSFSTSNIRVQLFQNEQLIDTKHVSFFKSYNSNCKYNSKSLNDSSFAIGMMFIVFSLSFDWSKFFLFIGLIFLFDSIYKKDVDSKTSESNNNDLDRKED